MLAALGESSEAVAGTAEAAKLIATITTVVPATWSADLSCMYCARLLTRMSGHRSRYPAISHLRLARTRATAQGSCLPMSSQLQASGLPANGPALQQQRGAVSVPRAELSEPSQPEQSSQTTALNSSGKAEHQGKAVCFPPSILLHTHNATQPLLTCRR